MTHVQPHFGIMWNNNDNNNNNNKEEAEVNGEDKDDSWEIRAFEEDITAGNQLGCTWPPRSYTCNFCRREFRSAQALGGHMNVHRGDRVRLHPHHPILPPPPPSSSSCNILSDGLPKSSTINLVPEAAAQELILPNGLCLFYSLPNPNGVFAQNYLSSSSTPHLIPVSPNIYPPPLPVHIIPDRANSDFSNKTETSAASNISSDADEVDLELRLGRGLISKDKIKVLD